MQRIIPCHRCKRPLATEHAYGRDHDLCASCWAYTLIADEYVICERCGRRWPHEDYRIIGHDDMSWDGPYCRPCWRLLKAEANQEAT